jgi:hypothetical protein
MCDASPRWRARFPRITSGFLRGRRLVPPASSSRHEWVAGCLRWSPRWRCPPAAATKRARHDGGDASMSDAETVPKRDWRQRRAHRPGRIDADLPDWNRNPTDRRADAPRVLEQLLRRRRLLRAPAAGCLRGAGRSGPARTSGAGSPPRYRQKNHLRRRGCRPRGLDAAATAPAVPGHRGLSLQGGACGVTPSSVSSATALPASGSRADRDRKITCDQSTGECLQTARRPPTA